MQEHISTSFDNDLNELDALVAKMSGMAQTQLNTLLSTMSDLDDTLLSNIIDADKAIDELEQDAFAKSVEIIALRSPHAEDLRKVMIVPRIASIIERIGDLVRNTAKRLIAIKSKGEALPFADQYVDLGREALDMLIDVNDAVARSDVEKSLKIWENDVNIDDAYNKLTRRIVKTMDDDGFNAEILSHCMFIAKNIERIGDHTTSIAELVHFRVKAMMISEDRPKLGDAEA